MCFYIKWRTEITSLPTAPRALLPALRASFLSTSTRSILLCNLVCCQHRRLKTGSSLDAICYSTLSIPLTFRAIHCR
jgi:hypothetical protein